MVLRLDLTSGKPTGGVRHRYGQQLARRSAPTDDGSLKDDYALSSSFEIAARWIAPWDARRYPGRQRLLQAVTGRAVNILTIGWWRRKHTAMPAWAARAWAAWIRQRSLIGLRLADELDAHADEIEANPRHGAHFRKMRAAGIAPSGIGARGKMRDPQT